MDDTEFLVELRQMVHRRAATMNLVDTLAFVSEVAERLEEDPVFGEFVPAEYVGDDSRRRPLRMYGFTELDESDGTLSLVIAKWAEGETPTSILTSDIEQLHGWLSNFVSECIKGKLDERIEESSSPYHIAHLLRDRARSISCIRLHIFSNQNLSQRYNRESRSEVAGVVTETHIWDLQRLKAIYSSSREREVVEIDLSNFGSAGIPCIKASSADGLQSYLCTIDGNLLADLFDLYRSRLLEGNVRSFLGMKGGVNKGIRATIQDAPALFFAYNNGIAATAAAVQFRDNGSAAITALTDLQIVNGGQTTASILRARKQDGLSLEGVTVPMKLTVVAREMAHDLIPKIAEYANTQNKVAIADFFANHPFHRKMEEISRRLLVPARAGERVQSKWFYERSRGQYQNERLYLTGKKKDNWDAEFPARQVVNKTELAKYDSTLNERPHWVSLGAQKNFIKFAGKFGSKSESKSESEVWDDLSPQFGDGYYQRIVAMALLWKRGEEIVSAGKGDWYLGDYRPQIVAYAWGIVFHAVRASGREPDLSKVWDRQGIDEGLEDVFKRAAIAAQKALLDLPTGSTNVGEWAKKEDCWTTVSKQAFRLGAAIEPWVVDRDENRGRRVEEKKKGATDDGISIQKQVLELSASGYWLALLEWSQLSKYVSPPERQLISKASNVQGLMKIGIESDWRRLLKIRQNCESEGFRFSK